jgi:hypothetical protein
MRALLNCGSSVVFLVVAILGLSGCHGTKSMAHVRGKVTYKDGSAPTGSPCLVLFSPADGSTAEVKKGASGGIQPDGTFEMVTRMPGDGVYVGTYNVYFTIRSPADSNVSLVDAKYAGPKTSGITETITGDRSDLNYVIEKSANAAVAAKPDEKAGAPKGPGL